MRQHTKHYYGACPRCGCGGQDADRRHPICADCRFVLSTFESEQWRETPHLVVEKYV